MQSSSELFPVALISAEIRGELTEDVYLLKPNNSPDNTVELALTRIGLRERSGDHSEPVVLLHGSFSNRRFWCSPLGIGAGAHLARQGFDVWILELRGHGLSPRNRDYTKNRVSQYVRYDLPAVAAFVQEQNGLAPHWVGHSLGGIVLAAALGGGYLDEASAASAALFGSQISRIYWPLKVPPVEWAGRLLLKGFDQVSGSRLKRGPEDEPIGLVKESLRWHGLFGRFGDSERDWWAGLADVRVPLLAAAGAGDTQDPAWACRKLFEQFGSAQKEYHCLGKADGFSQDYGHVDMLVSKGAQKEVWPLLAAWLLRAGKV